MHIEADIKHKFEFLQARYSETVDGNFGIEYLHMAKDKLVARMPVDKRTQQPFGLLHGGASMVLAESLASIGGWFNVNEDKLAVVGMEINANHLRPVRSGSVTGTATPIHLGSKTQIWEIKITNSDDKLACISRCTLATIEIDESPLK